MSSYADWVVEMSNTTGTGAYALAGVPAGSGFFTFRQRFGNGANEIVFWVMNKDGTKREKNRFGTLTYGTPDSLSRNVIASTNGDAAVSWVGGDIPLLVYIAQDSDVLNAVAGAVSFQTGAVLEGTLDAIIPGDDTIPQSTEGDQCLELAYTPVLATSTLVIEGVVQASHTSAAPNTLIAAVFRDAGASAIGCGWQALNGTWAVSVAFRVEVAAGSTASTTFRVRIGATNTGTTTVNGINGARFLGGMLLSSITIREIP